MISDILRKNTRSQDALSYRDSLVTLEAHLVRRNTATRCSFHLPRRAMFVALAVDITKED